MYEIVTLLLLRVFGSSVIAAESSTIRGDLYSPFICTDGTRVELSRVCNGLPDCPDSSDELRKLCHRVVCPMSHYRCAYGACVPKKARCDGLQDCLDASDEFACEVPDVCTDRQFHCLQSNHCIPLDKICNGYSDCSDGSDESATLCENYPCPSSGYRCVYGGCIHRETVCDGAKDCVDGSDEQMSICASINCRGSQCLTSSCRNDEYHCHTSGECIPTIRVCDGTPQCRDTSDEKPEVCKNRTCGEGFFRCKYGGCIPEVLRCNLQPNCQDWSDEDEAMCGVSPPEGACRLPPAAPGTHYVVSNCAECRPGGIVPELTRLDYSCDTPGSLEGASSVYCRDNRWSTLPVCVSETSEITCRPIEAPGARKSCEAIWGPRQGWIDCNSTSPIGTRVTLQCPEYYERESGSSRTTCLHDGTWSQQPLHCRPICGVRDSASVAALIIKGWELKPEDSLPWHATLFSHDNGEWKFFCGGTLLSERAVLTAGHCVWKTDEKTLRVAFAMFSSNFTKRNAETQVFGVESIRLQGAYQDHEGNYGSDAAILILDGPVIVNTAVKPACLERSRSMDVSQRIGDIGLVAGMGITENDTYSANLRVTSLQIVAYDTCRQSQKQDFRKYITYTTFCAGWLNGSAVCNGDSGGGVFLKNSVDSHIWEVHGIVSISPRRIGTSICDPNYYTIFTKVSAYVDWILEILSTLPVVGPPAQQEVRPNKDIIEL